MDKFLFVTQIILYLCRSPKSRENDSLSNLIDEQWKQGMRLPVPAVAIDSHCQAGRKVYGRFGANDGKENLRITKWFHHWAKINNEAYPDKWQKKLKQIWIDKSNSQAL